MNGIGRVDHSGWNIPVGMSRQGARCETGGASAQDAFSAKNDPIGPKAAATRGAAGTAIETIQRLAARFDVHALSRNEYGEILKQLRDANCITAEEFSAAYGGFATPELASELRAWPVGSAKSDFAALLEQRLAQYQSAQDAAAGTEDGQNIEAMFSAGSRVCRLFQEIDAVASEEQAKPAAEAAVVEKTAKAKPKNKIEELTELLKQDEAYMKRSGRSFLQDPTGRKLATAMIESDGSALQYIANGLGVTPGQVKSMLHSGDWLTEGQALIQFQHLLIDKAKTVGLTETERLLDADAARLELVYQGTFDQRMEPVRDAIEAEFQNAGMTYDPSKRYEFSLDTSTFQFSVSGGSPEENALIEKVVNQDDHWTQYKTKAISALYRHRREDGKYNPWNAKDLPLEKDALIAKHGVASVSKGYADKMDCLEMAFNRFLCNGSMQERYGFGFGDLTCSADQTFTSENEQAAKMIAGSRLTFMMNAGGAYLHLLNRILMWRYGFDLNGITVRDDGTVVGKTDEITERLEQAGPDFIQKADFETPEFDEPVFALENGKFEVLYQ